MSLTHGDTTGAAEHLRAVDAALAARDMERAIELANKALAMGVETPLLLNLSAYADELRGDYDQSLSKLSRALARAPRDSSIVASMGVCLSKLGRAQEALAAFDAAIQINPNYAMAHSGRGLMLAALMDVEPAREALERAAALDPGFAEPVAALAGLASDRGDYDSARTYATRALQLDSNQPTATLALAYLDHRDGRNDAVISRLQRLFAESNLTTLHRANAQLLLADALDAVDRTSEALEAYQAGNAAIRDTHSRNAERIGLELGVEYCHRLHAFFEAALTRSWLPIPVAEGESGIKGHAFLVGFPRSGTTLLEQVLASHPDVVALEEKPPLAELQSEYFDDDAALARLAVMDSKTAIAARKQYWRRVREFGVEPSGKVFIDKLPLSTPFLPLIAKLFPTAKIIFARRDPRDVVVSCFRRRFRQNAMILEFTSIERTARLYDAVMRLAELYFAKLPLDVHIYRYESLVEDFDSEAKSLCAFLGLKWDAAMRDFAETARKRDVRTPSAPQVRRGLYKEGVGQWRRYSEGLTSVLPILRPWVERYRYPKD